MKAMRKTIRGKGFLGLAKYHLEKTELIGGNMSAVSPEGLAHEFNQVRRLRPDIAKPVWHQALRLPAGERISKEKWVEIADEYMQELGFTEFHQRYYALEDDPEGQHIHIGANRIALDGSVYLGRNENIISTRIVAKLEKNFGLLITKTAEYIDDKVVMPEKTTIKKK